MQLTESLEELFQIFGAYIIQYNQIEYTVVTHKPFPADVEKIATGINVNTPFTPIQTMTGAIVAEVKERSTYEYTFLEADREAIRALLFLATEKERYNKFCKAIDSEITKELGT